LAEELKALIVGAAPGLPSIRARNRVEGFSRLGGSERLGADAFRDQPVGALLAVARPERVLETIPARVVHCVTRRDHHFWEADEVRSIAEEAKRRGAVALVTTGKDAVKMGFDVSILPLHVLRIETEILDRSSLETLLGAIL
jgi:tetraacyldisaccharide 4'-kinase